MPDVGLFEIISMEHAARSIEFALAGGRSINSHMASANIIGFYDGLSPVPDYHTNTVTVLNPPTSGNTYRFGGAQGTRGTAVHCPSAGIAAYVITQMDCP
jgi:hypothetical protein